MGTADRGLYSSPLLGSKGMFRVTVYEALGWGREMIAENSDRFFKYPMSKRKKEREKVRKKKSRTFTKRQTVGHKS